MQIVKQFTQICHEVTIEVDQHGNFRIIRREERRKDDRQHRPRQYKHHHSRGRRYA